jgi:hypothetical protein
MIPAVRAWTAAPPRYDIAKKGRSGAAPLQRKGKKEKKKLLQAAD